jgi:hypothetical protein
MMDKAEAIRIALAEGKSPEYVMELVKALGESIPPGVNGHAPAELRQWFDKWALDLDCAPIEYGGKPRWPEDVGALLWLCAEVMPAEVCDALKLPQGSTYGRRPGNDYRPAPVPA